MGDGTTSVVILASELLNKALEMAKRQIHPSAIISGYKTACKQAVQYIQDCLALDVTAQDREQLLQVANTSLSSKLVTGESKLFGEMAVQAVLAVRHNDAFPIKNIGVVKCHGRSLMDSECF